jgi:hypothetical protein
MNWQSLLNKDLKIETITASKYLKEGPNLVEAERKYLRKKQTEILDIKSKMYQMEFSVVTYAKIM